MFKVLKLGRFKKGIITTKYPKEPFIPSENFKGMPIVDTARCTKAGVCASACPTGAITVTPSNVTIDVGLCIFCGACERACPNGAIKLSLKYELATKNKDHLQVVY